MNFTDPQKKATQGEPRFLRATLGRGKALKAPIAMIQGQRYGLSLLFICRLSPGVYKDAFSDPEIRHEP